MAISFETALGIHPQALAFRGMRAELLAGNLANVDTPGFKARDMTFETILKRKIKPTEKNERHIDFGFLGSTESLQYRIPYQQSSDGNSVELGVEQASFAQNSLDFQTSLTFLKKKLSSLELAIRGGL